MVLGLLGAATFVHANDLIQLNRLTPGADLNVGPLNENFYRTEQSINALDKRLLALNERMRQLESAPPSAPIATGLNGRLFSLDAVFCAATSTPTLGRITAGLEVGLEAAKTLCEDACGMSPTAHMCSADELSRSIQLSILPTAPEGWYSNMSWAVNGPESNFDCNNWTQTTPNWTGASLRLVDLPGREFQPGRRSCSSEYPILCCD